MTEIVLYLVITAVFAYLAGGLNGAIIASKTVHKQDVRNYGSGNAGLTNFNRAFGTKGILIVLGVDVIKAVASTLIGGWLIGRLGYADLGRLFGGFCCMLGHVYPVYYRFKGGKAALSGGVVAFMVDWRVGLLCVAVFLVVVIFTRYVSLGSMLAAVTYPIATLCFGYTWLEVILAVLGAALVVYAHRENIRRLAHGTESKLTIGGKS